VDIVVDIETLQSPLIAGGSPLTSFIVSARNSGFVDASNVVLTQTSSLPADAKIVSAPPSTGTFTNGNWNLDLARGEAISLMIVTQAGPDAASGPNALTFGMVFTSSDQVETPTDNNSATISIPILNNADIVLDFTPPEFDNQSGLFNAATTVTNNGTVDLPAARLFITNLPADTKLSNASGTTSRGSYILLNSPLTTGSSENVNVELSRVNQDSNFSPVYELELLPWSIVDPVSAGGRVTVSQAHRLISGDQFIEIASIPGATYEMEYTSDFSIWQTVRPQIMATADRLLWLDNGPPKTDIHPREASKRFYRFRLISMPIK